MASAMAAPRFPALSGYPDLAAGLRALGLRHAGDLVWPDATQRRAPGFQLLDGFRVQRAGHGTTWWLVDRALLAQERRRAAGRFPNRAQLAERLFDLIDVGMAQDPMSLRHLVLYQVVTILGERGTIRERHVTQLGVEEKEASAVAALAAAQPRFDDAARDAAERLLDEFAAGRLLSAAQLAAKVPANHGDERLTRLCRAVRERVTAADALLDEAARLAAAGDILGAAESYRRAANRVPDDPRPRIGMIDAALRLGVALDASAAPASAITVTEAGTGSGIAVHCAAPRATGSGARIEFEFWRVPQGAPNRATRLGVVSDLASPLLDTGVDFGETVTYAVLPRRDGLVCGPAVAGTLYRRAPEIRSPRIVPTPSGVRARWRAPEGVRQIQVTRFGPRDAGAGVAVPSGVDGFDDLVSGFGECRYEVRCGYADARGGMVWSAGWSGSARLAQWPIPVRIVRVKLLENTAGPSGGDAEAAGSGDTARQVRVSWRTAGSGTDRMTVWPYTAREHGDDISHLIDRLPQALADESGPADQPDDDSPPEQGSIRSTVISALPGKALRLTGVSLLGTRAVAGDSVLICLPAPDAAGDAAALQLRRVDAVSAEARFAWPEPAALVRMVVERDGYPPLNWVLARSLTRGQPVRFPVGREGALVAVEPLMPPGTGPAIGETATAELPALPPDPAAPARLAYPADADQLPNRWNTWMDSTAPVEPVPYPPGVSSEPRRVWWDLRIVARIPWRAALRASTWRALARPSTWRAVISAPLRIRVLRRRRQQPPRP